MRQNRKVRQIVLAAASASLVLGGSALAATGTFTVSGTTQAALTVSCPTNLRFGTIAVEPNNLQATITVDAAAAASATSSSIADVYAAAADSGPGTCTVSNETGTNATASLSAATGLFSGTTLSGVNLVNGANTLSANVMLSKADLIGNETLYIGGALTIPAMHSAFGTYSETITITVTD